MILDTTIESLHSVEWDERWLWMLIVSDFVITVSTLNGLIASNEKKSVLLTVYKEFER